MTDEDDALELFADGFGCSQAVLGAYAPALGLDFGTAMRLAAPFSAPLCPDGLCGALSGALMALSATCRSDCVTPAARADLRALTDELSDAFRARLGSLVCRDIVVCGLRTAAGMAEARKRGLIATRCTPAVQVAVELLEAQLSRLASGT